VSGNPRAIDPAAQSWRAFNALANLLARVTPWLLTVGSWIFGGLIAFDLLFIPVMLNIRPVDLPIRISLAAFAIGLPLNVTGLFLLRLVKDLTEISVGDLTFRSFQEAGFPDLEAYLPPIQERRKLNERRSRLAVGYSFAMAGVGVVLTLIGFVAAFWHVAWWIGVVLVATVAPLRDACPGNRRTLPFTGIGGGERTQEPFPAKAILAILSSRCRNADSSCSRRRGCVADARSARTRLRDSSRLSRSALMRTSSAVGGVCFGAARRRAASSI
jgi:hypothetical protein